MPQKYGYLANSVGVSAPCIVCDEPQPTYSWTDFHGEGYCIKCGTPYQLKAAAGADPNEKYPRCNIKKEYIPLLRQYWKETGRGNGLGTFMIERDYPDQIENRRAFDEWVKEHPELKLIEE